jgi:hypothetical protein
MQRNATTVQVCKAIALFFLLGMASNAFSQDAEAQVAPSQSVLRDSIWFDAERGELKPVKVKPTNDDSLNRESRWLPKADRVRVPKAPNANAGATGGAGGGLFGSGLTLGNLFGWLLLLAIVVASVIAIKYALSRRDVEFARPAAGRNSKRSEGPDAQTIERMKHLPAELRRSGVNLRSEAQRLMEEANFDQAIILLLAHQLLLLDRSGLLRLNRGKTNRRYIRETRSVDQESAERLRATAQAFERSYFGAHALTSDEFTRLWVENESLERTLQQRQEVAA